MINNNLNKGGTAYNRAYLATDYRPSPKFPLRETSDTLGTLYAIGLRRAKSKDGEKS